VNHRPDPERANPHGWLGYVVSDRRRTDNAIRLGRSVALCVLVVIIFAAISLAIVATVSPVAACGMVSLATVGAGAVVRRRGRRR
jgi:hypothetical protein